ncbi:MAG: hypothetical protein ABR906_13785 [Terracidiphilus sp.]
MVRPLALSLAAGLALASAALSRADETFPVVHREPITVRILSGENGQPLAHLHLILLGGYDQHDLRRQLYREERLTDAHGQTRLSNQLANLPWLQVWVNKKPLCQANPRAASFSVELIRRDGLSAPNRCGIATVVDAPGVFTVFVKGEDENALMKLIGVASTRPTPAPAAGPAAIPATLPPAHIANQAIQPTPHPPLAEVVLVAPALVSLETVLEAPAPVSAPAPAPITASVSATASVPVKAQARIPVRRVAIKPVVHHAKPVAHRATPVAHKARLLPIACAVRPPAASPVPAPRPILVPVAAPAPSPDKTKSVPDKSNIDVDTLEKPPATVAAATYKSKPPAGVRKAASAPIASTAPIKQQ